MTKGRGPDAQEAVGGPAECWDPRGSCLLALRRFSDECLSSLGKALGECRGKPLARAGLSWAPTPFCGDGGAPSRPSPALLTLLGPLAGASGCPSH